MKRGNLDFFANARGWERASENELGVVYRVDCLDAARAALSSEHRGPPESHPRSLPELGGDHFSGGNSDVRTLRSGAARRTTPSSGDVVGERSGGGARMVCTKEGGGGRRPTDQERAGQLFHGNGRDGEE